MAEARALKLCTKGDYIKSGQRDDKSPIKGAWFCSRDPFCMRNSGLIINSPRNSVNCVNNAVDGLLLIAPTALEATLRLRPILHRFDLSLYLLQSWLYNIDNKLTKWSLSIIVQICGSNRHFSVCVAVCYQPTLVCLVIKLGGQCDMVDFALSSVARYRR